MIKKILHKIFSFFHTLFIQLFKIDDSAHKIALGLGLGVFTGILPGTGPVAAVFLAFIFRANRASALIGSLLTNTWLSILTFLLSIKIGAYLTGLNWQEVYRTWQGYIKAFEWANLFKVSLLRVILPVFLGYLALGACLGILSYLVALYLINKLKNRGK